MQLQRRRTLSGLINIVAHDKSANRTQYCKSGGVHTVVASNLIGIVSNHPMTKTTSATSMTGLAYLQCSADSCSCGDPGIAGLPSRYASE